MRRALAVVVCSCLAIPEAGLAAVCGTANIPGATLLAPHFRVSRNGVTSAATDIPDLPHQIDTLMAVTNVGRPGLIVHVTVWSKYGVPVLGFNVPMTAYDVMYFRMKDILNGKLNVNPNTQNGLPSNDPCGINQVTGAYMPATGFSPTKYTRFPNPDATDAHTAVSRFQTPAFNGMFRQRVWDSLDESGDVKSVNAPGEFMVDEDSVCSPGDAVDGVLSGDFSGYVTFDVVNYCTAFSPNQPEYYANDAIATAGWKEAGYTPNTLIGDVFTIDSTEESAHVSGDAMVAIEFDPARADWSSHRTFYARYSALTPADTGVNPAVPAPFRFNGDGREALGTDYGFRYLSNAPLGLRSWAVIWRSDRYGPDSSEIDLCHWLHSEGVPGSGFFDPTHRLRFDGEVSMFDSNENLFVPAGGGSPGYWPPDEFVFLESQRLDLLSNGDMNPGGYLDGWIEIHLTGTPRYAQAYVSAQHSGPGAMLSVGLGATLLNRATCEPAIPPGVRRGE